MGEHEETSKDISERKSCDHDSAAEPKSEPSVKRCSRGAGRKTTVGERASQFMRLYMCMQRYIDIDITHGFYSGYLDNLRYADDTILMAEREEELKSLLMKVKEESEKVG